MQNYWIMKKSKRITTHTIELFKDDQSVFESAIIVKTLNNQDFGFSTIDKNMIQLITSLPNPKSNGIPLLLDNVEMKLISFNPVRRRISVTTFHDIKLIHYHKNSAGMLAVLIKSPDVPFAYITP